MKDRGSCGVAWDLRPTLRFWVWVCILFLRVVEENQHGAESLLPGGPLCHIAMALGCVLANCRPYPEVTDALLRWGFYQCENWSTPRSKPILHGHLRNAGQLLSGSLNDNDLNLWRHFDNQHNKFSITPSGSTVKQSPWPWPYGKFVPNSACSFLLYSALTCQNRSLSFHRLLMIIMSFEFLSTFLTRFQGKEKIHYIIITITLHCITLHYRHYISLHTSSPAVEGISDAGSVFKLLKCNQNTMIVCRIVQSRFHPAPCVLAPKTNCGNDHHPLHYSKRVACATQITLNNVQFITWLT